MTQIASTISFNTSVGVTDALNLLASIVITMLVCYVSLCRGLRYLRRDQQHSQTPYKTREDFRKMTAEDAWQIANYVQSLEFPWITKKALSFALFKTYGIPSISKLLCETQQLGKVEYAGRRYADTSILIAEFLGYSPTSERANSAIARMNYLHSRYQKANKISNEDMLYTLSLFVMEVERWIKLYEWRVLTPMEICAFGTLWKAIGDAIDIDYSSLRHGPETFKDGLEFFEDIKEWAEKYESKYMVPDKYNHQLAEETTRILLANAPEALKPYGQNVVAALMDDRLRRAMLYGEPPLMYIRIVKTIFGVRKFISRWLLPPRPYAFRARHVTDDPDPQTGRYFMTEYENEPWYIKPTFSMRYSPLAWLRWAAGKPYPNGKGYNPQGYKIFEVGPKKLEGYGLDECEATRDRLMGSNRGQCPFAFS
ncbi:uncharacterized protein EKO05_0001432 [Ascochyta rabiei]|uniref:ER-bound oxygenase mpaB/mpaB'/Rubber oxygenase catalytic domain-containing protein n=1 Tax=Didymella rabiei TaxID=5454 RepID=A0A163MCB4_DIDRA|nr:uncharacterized protein EKO05_0001432 [Ascochyta rabiei]KZM28588.1 hypothetical protein ST47_g265 [Ascochyta rabiei]UPX10793.1 hypothetical protein EKO05_0001432 [Ascochyta rabiei]